MLFEWDEAKSRRNLRERGFGFDYAAGIFAGPTLERRDDRRDYGEVRMQAIGRVGDDILFVAFTDRGDVRHLISARLANRKERKLWHSFAEHWTTSAG
ncbi:MAG: uncharacterized protein QOF19_1598 [Alphaproteobacteria bacterium]|jgi:uncharacterized DUF497 family protein|nr:uncharacterized protein [Alphaproteobacteria bacterium]